MARKHRKARNRSSHLTKITTFGAVTATAAALTVGASPLPDPASKTRHADVDLAAAINQWPDPHAIPDLTFGLGTAAYNATQAAADVFIRAVVENFNLAALARAAGADPDSILDTLFGGILSKIPSNLLDEVVGSIPLDTTGLVGALVTALGAPALAGPLSTLLSGALPDTLGGLLGLLGINLSDVLNLSDLAGPANIITAGPVFTLLKLMGADLGWVPGLPNSVANEVNNSSYLDASVSLSSLLGDIGVLAPVQALLTAAGISIPDLNAVQVRVPVLVGFGLGAFSAGAAYQQIVKDLQHQPGGQSAAENSVVGSFTVLPILLLRNPGRANGGLLARFYPLFRLFGIDTVTPDTAATNSGGTVPLLNTGLSLGGSNLVPVKIDGTVQYDPLSDVTSWPNPFSMVNNIFAGMMPTYILRGLTLDEDIEQQLTTPLTDLLEGVENGDPLAINLYLTISSATLPLLEPLYLAADMVNLMTFGAAAGVNPFSRIANALAPALTSLVNLGYTDVVFDRQVGGYVRTNAEAGDPTPFFSFPNVNWAQVPGVIVSQLVAGIQKEFFSGNPTPGTPNAISNLIDFIAKTVIGGLPAGGLLSGPLGQLSGLVDDILGRVLGNLSPQTVSRIAAPAQATSVPSGNARTLTLKTGNPDEKPSAAEQSGQPAAPVKNEDGAGDGAQQTPGDTSGEVVDDHSSAEDPAEQPADDPAEKPADDPAEESDDVKAPAEQPADAEADNAQSDDEEPGAETPADEQQTPAKPTQAPQDDKKPANTTGTGAAATDGPSTEAAA